MVYLKFKFIQLWQLKYDKTIFKSSLESYGLNVKLFDL